MKRIKFLVAILISISAIFFTGCTHEMVDLYIYKMPNKLVYEIGEKIDTDGIELKGVKTDSALTRISKNKANFSGFDSSTKGKKEVIVSYGNFTASYTIYIANRVVSNDEELKAVMMSLEDDDIVLIKEGNYNLLTGIEIDASNVVIGGQGKDKTKINSFIIIGGNLNGEEILYTSDVKNISFIGISFETNSRMDNEKITFDNPNYNFTFGAINAKNLEGLNIVACSFKGFSYGLKLEKIENSLITSNDFEKLYVGGIYVTKNTKNSTFSKNIIKNIGQNTVFFNKNEEQEFIFGINLAFESEENAGVSVYKNSISRIAIKDSKVNFINQKTNKTLWNFNYILNSSAIIMRSTGKNNLQSQGISIFFNSMGATLNNILYNTNENDRINSSSIMYMSL